MSESAAGWLAAGVRIRWSDPYATGSPVRLDLTLSLSEADTPPGRAIWTALRSVQRSIPGSVRVVVLRGAASSFWSGSHSGTLAAALAEPPTDAELAAYQLALDWTSDPAYVSVAAVHGQALGAGFQLALGCDLRVVTADAVLGLTEAGLGLVPGLGATGTLVAAVGYAGALELCSTGRRLHGREAHALGLAQRVVEPERLDDEIEALVSALLAPPRDAVREIKALLLGAGRPALEQRAAERAAQLRRFAELTEPADPAAGKRHTET